MFVIIYRLDLVEPQPYCKMLKRAKELLAKDEDQQNVEMIVNKLGNDVLATSSVPTAIYCFVKAQKPIKGINTDNQLRRAMQFAVSQAYLHTKSNFIIEIKF